VKLPHTHSFIRDVVITGGFIAIGILAPGSPIEGGFEASASASDGSSSLVLISKGIVMDSRRNWIKGALALLLLTAATGALAGNTGTEFQSLYTWLTGMVQGYFGKAAAIAAIGLGALFSLARLNPMPILSGVAFAVFLQYAPTISTGILTATI
jgi:conjugal transfer pilus assembly protein TraA